MMVENSTINVGAICKEPAATARRSQKSAKSLAREAAGLNRVSDGLWLVLAAMIVQFLLPCVAMILWAARFKLSSILQAYQIASVLPVILQIAGHYFCLSLPRAVRLGRAPEDMPARGIVIFVLALDLVGLLLFVWARSAKFDQYSMSVWLPDVYFALFVPVILLQFLRVVVRHIGHSDLADDTATLHALLAVILLLGVPMLAVAGGVLVAFAVGVISLPVVYFFYIWLLIFLHKAIRAYAAELTSAGQALAERDS
jgi:hypothetical protein